MKHIAILLAILPISARADPAEILAATVQRPGGNTAFSVTLAHPDTGWGHFADAWRVELADGTVLGERVLVHPHEAEQPFTRSLSGVAIPEGVGQVFIRSRCLVDGWGADVFEVTL